MTNFEYYAEDIKAVGYNFAIKKDGEFASCLEKTCDLCIFGEGSKSCTDEKIKWLYEEHKEQQKLTKDERKLCEIIASDTYIARDKSGSLFVYDKKPYKKDDRIGWCTKDYCVSISDFIFADCNFSFIKWEDEEPWKVSDLLKLEVMDNE